MSSAMEQLTAAGDGVDNITRAAIAIMLQSVRSGKVNFANVFPKRQKIWQKIPLVINDPPLDVQCKTLLNMTNGNRKMAIRHVVENRFAASPQPEQEDKGPTNISSFVDKFYSSNGGLSMAGFVTKHLLNFVLPGNIGSQAEAIAYLLYLQKQCLELFMWLKTTFWCTLRNVALIAMLHGQKLDDHSVQDLLLWCFLQRTTSDTSVVKQSNTEALIAKIVGAGSTEQSAMDKIRKLFPDDAGEWQRVVLTKASELFSPRKQYVIPEVAAMAVLWLLPIFVGIADGINKLIRILLLLEPMQAALVGTTIVSIGTAIVYAYRSHPEARALLERLHPLRLFSKNPSVLVSAVLLVIPAVLYCTNAHRFGVAVIEFLQMIPDFFSRAQANGLQVDSNSSTLTLVVSFWPPTMLRNLHYNAGIVQSLHVLAICTCSFGKVLLKASLAKSPSSMKERRQKLRKKLGKLEHALLVATLAWPALVAIEIFWFKDLNPWELVLRQGKAWWLAKYTAKVGAVFIESRLWKTLVSADFLAQVLTPKTVAKGLFASVGAFWHVFYSSQDNQSSFKETIESLTPSSGACLAIKLARDVAFPTGLLLALLTNPSWGRTGIIAHAVCSWTALGPTGFFVTTRLVVVGALATVVTKSYRSLWQRASLERRNEEQGMNIIPKGHWRRLLTVLPPGIDWLDQIPAYLETLDDLMNSPGPVLDIGVTPTNLMEDGSMDEASTDAQGIAVIWSPGEGAECYEVSVAPHDLETESASHAARTLVAKFLLKNKKALQRALSQQILATTTAFGTRCVYSFEELVALRTDSVQAEAEAPRQRQSWANSALHPGKVAAHDLMFRVRGVSTRTGVRLAGPWSPWSKTTWGRLAAGSVEFRNRNIPALVPAGLEEFSVHVRQMVGLPNAMVPWDEVHRSSNDIVGIFESSVAEDQTTRYAKRGLTNMKNWSWHYMQSAKPATDLDHFDQCRVQGSSENHAAQSWYSVTFVGDQLPTASRLLAAVPGSPGVSGDEFELDDEFKESDLIDQTGASAGKQALGSTTDDSGQNLTLLCKDTARSTRLDDLQCCAKASASGTPQLSTFEFRYISSKGTVLARSSPFAIRPLSVYTETTEALAQNGQCSESGIRLFATWEPPAQPPSSANDQSAETQVGPDLSSAGQREGSTTDQDNIHFVSAVGECGGRIGFRYIRTRSFLRHLTGKWIEVPESHVKSMTMASVVDKMIRNNDGDWDDISSEQQQVLYYDIPRERLQPGGKYSVQIRYRDPRSNIATKWSRSVQFTYLPHHQSLGAVARNPEEAGINSVDVEGRLSIGPATTVETVPSINTDPKPDVPSKPAFKVLVGKTGETAAVCFIQQHTVTPDDATPNPQQTDSSTPLPDVDHFELCYCTSGRFSRWSAPQPMVQHESLSPSGLVASLAIASLSPSTTYLVRVRLVYRTPTAPAEYLEQIGFETLPTVPATVPPSVVDLRTSSLDTSQAEICIVIPNNRSMETEDDATSIPEVLDPTLADQPVAAVEIQLAKGATYFRNKTGFTTYMVVRLDTAQRPRTMHGGRHDATNGKTCGVEHSSDVSASDPPTSTVSGDATDAVDHAQTLFRLLEGLEANTTYRVRARIVSLRMFSIPTCTDPAQVYDDKLTNLQLTLATTDPGNTVLIPSNQSNDIEIPGICLNERFENQHYQGWLEAVAPAKLNTARVGVLEHGEWSTGLQFSSLAEPAVLKPILELQSLEPPAESLEPPATRVESTGNSSTSTSTSTSPSSDSDSDLGNDDSAADGDKDEDTADEESPSSTVVADTQKYQDGKATVIATVSIKVDLPEVQCDWRPKVLPIGNLVVQYSTSSRLSRWKTVDIRGTPSGAMPTGSGLAEATDCGLVSLATFLDAWQNKRQSLSPAMTITLPPLTVGKTYLVRCYFESLKTTSRPKPRCSVWSDTLQITSTQL